MKALVRRATILVVVGLIAVPAVAQPRGGPGFIDRMQEELQLSDEQTEQISAVFDEAKANCDDASGRDEFRECMHAQRDDIQPQVEALLSEEQLELQNELREQRGNPMLRRLEFMQEKLGLSDVQVEAAKVVFEAAKENCDTVQGFDAMHECMRSQRDTIHTELESILTEEQLEEMKGLRGRREGFGRGSGGHRRGRGPA